MPVLKFALLLAMLLASSSASASLGAHYLGENAAGAEFRLYIDGGAYLGSRDGLQSVSMAARVLRRAQQVTTSSACTYRYDPRDAGRNRIECAVRAGDPLSGVVYVREKAQQAPKVSKGVADEGAVEPMVCQRNCSPRLPQRLSLEAEGDNH